MSIFGEPLAHEDDTAASLIRREGFPPQETYSQMPEVYLCPCCSEFGKQSERDHLSRLAQDEKDAERRRLLQLDVFDERAKPLQSGDGRRKPFRRALEDEDPAFTQDSVPAPPQTLDELRRAQAAQSADKLIVTVHHGKNLSAEPRDPLSVIIRCVAFEGQTAKVPRGKGPLTPWDELFEFPYPNSEEPLEVLLVNDGSNGEEIVGGVIIPAQPLHDRTRGDEESIPIMPEDQMNEGFGQMKEGPLGAVIVSWYVRKDGEDRMDEAAMEQQNLEQPLGCTFVAHRVFQYTDNGSEPYPGGVLCVLRDTDDNCSESILFTPGSIREPSLSPFFVKEGFHYLPENPAQIMQLNTEKKLGHILVCVPKQDDAPAEEEEELLVVGAVPLDFERLYHRGSAVLFIESKSKDDALWGEISIEWSNRPLSDGSDSKIPKIEVEKDSLYVTVVRGLNLARRDGQPVEEAYVSVSAGDMEGTTVTCPNQEDGENHLVNWNQEIRFVDVDHNDKHIEVMAFENGKPVSTGHCELNEEDEGVCIIQMHDLYNEDEDRGEIVLSYKRLYAPRQLTNGRGMRDGGDMDEEEEELHIDADEEDEEQEETNVEHIDSGAGAAQASRQDGADNSEHRGDDSDAQNRDADEEEEEQAHDGQDATDAQDREDGEDGHDGQDATDAQDGEDDQDDQEDTDAQDGQDGRDGDDGKDGHDGEDTTEARDGQDGQDGHDGEDTTEARDGDDGQDGHDGEDTTEARDGQDGRDGRDGEDTTETQDGQDGRDGRDGEDTTEAHDGKDGRDGRDGEDTTDAHDGQDGRDGQDGQDGHDGEDATDAQDGQDGRDGQDATDAQGGQDGHDGEDGTDAQDGQDGRDGQDATDAHDGQDGHDGEDATDAQDGQDGRDGQDDTDAQDGADGQDDHDDRDGQDATDAKGDKGAAGSHDDDKHGDDARRGDDDNAGRTDDNAGAGAGAASAGQGDDSDEAARGQQDSGRYPAGQDDDDEPEYVPPPRSAPLRKPSGAGTSPVASGGRSPASRDSRRGSRRDSSAYKAPWYPSGSPQSQTNLPYEKTNLNKKSNEGIRDLEALHKQLVEESIRRSPQRSPGQGSGRRSSRGGTSPSRGSYQ